MATDQENYESAIAETPPVEAPVEQTSNVEETKQERPRDEKGRYVAATSEPDEAPAPVEQPTERPVEREDARVPSWRLAEEAERRRSAEQALNELRSQFQQFQHQFYSMQQQAPQQEEPPVDIFTNPEGFVSHLEQRFAAQRAQDRLETSLRFAHYQHGDTFQKAYDGFMEHVSRTRDQASYQRVMASQDPGTALVQWYKEQQLHKELGGADLPAFLEKQKQEWLKDPAVQAQIIEHFKASQGAQPSNLTNLPPSLSKASASRSSHDESVTGYGNDMYSYATAKK